LLFVQFKLFMKKSFRIALVVLGGWIILAQSCMTMRKSDKDAIADFAKKGIVLRSKTTEKNGHSLHYVMTGADSLPTLVFVHGTPGSWTAFEPYLADSLLLTKYRLVSFDRPGFGYSDYGGALPMPAQSAIMGPVIQSLKNGKSLWLVGHSMGGPMIMQLEIDYPGLATGLVLIAGSIDPAAEKPEKWRPVIFKTPLNYLVPGAMRPSNKELWYLKEDLKTMAPGIAKITCAVYFIHGTKDTWVPPSNVPYGMARLTSAVKKDTLWLDGNHFIPWSKYDSIRNYLMLHCN
jgi:pimeloyl-ACP methyl ester carboxylesterase